ncbi:hypothetical protein HFO61_03820 [Rhizobium leguminosarum]|nr:hypothetical protein [Rhizobium leguminosarum]MBY5545977.1 hypothetical protein [Rhizobium leguminosarum]
MAYFSNDQRLSARVRAISFEKVQGNDVENEGQLDVVAERLKRHFSQCGR